MTTIMDLLIEEACDGGEPDELEEALSLGIKTGQLEAVCPLCCQVVPDHTPGKASLCCDNWLEPDEVRYRATKPS